MSDRPAADGLPSFDTLFDVEGEPPDEPLLRAYGGPLRIRREHPSLVANFVATADGVAAFGNAGGDGAGAVSLHSAADRYLMALLRSTADIVLIGASTMRDDLRHQWTAATVAPRLREELAGLRLRATGQARPVPLGVVTGSGRLPEGHPALVKPEAEVLILTTEAGRRRLPTLHESVRVASLADTGEIAPGAILEFLRVELGAVTVLSEGGPRLFGQLLDEGAVDELFLTLAPHLAGRSGGHHRPAIVEGVAFLAGATPRLALRSARRSGEHLFLRYSVEPRLPTRPATDPADSPPPRP